MGHVLRCSGYELAKSDILHFYPPLTIGQDDIAQLLENLDDILKAQTNTNNIRGNPR